MGVGAFGFPRPVEALGPALHHNDGYDLYRLNPALPGVDHCSFEQRSRVTQRAVG